MMTSSSKNIAIVLYHKTTMMDFIGATEVFNNALLPDNTPAYTIHWLAPTLDPITTSEGFQVMPTISFTAFEQQNPDIEILFIPGGNYEGVQPAMFDPAYRNFIAYAAAKAHWSGSVCTGAFIGVAGGIFNNCAITTYWSQLENLSLLQNKYGITVPDGYPRFWLDHARKRFSGGGISSSVDLALALVQELLGQAASEKAQLFIQYAPGPPNQSGDPSQAPIAITKEVLQLEKSYSANMLEAVMQLIAEG